MPVDQARYKMIVGLIIDQLEGGYYHPDMMAANPVKFKLYGYSGETMFGIDRRYHNSTAAAKRFWAIVDSANARKNWAWNYGGGTFRQKLKDAAAEVMYDEYDVFANKYLSKQAKAIIETDDRLLFNFIYATWNGDKWFRILSGDFNAAVAKGITNKDELVKVAVASRISSGNTVITQGGKKIAKFINTITQQVTEYVKANPVKMGIVVAVVLGMMVYYVWAVRERNSKIIIFT